MRISEVERSQTPADVPKGVFDLARKDKFFKMAVDVLALGRTLGDNPPPAKVETFEKIVQAVMQRLGAKHDLDPFVCYRVCYELEWQQFRKAGIEKDVAAIDAMIAAGRYDEARESIRSARTRWRSKVFNKLSSKINSLDHKR